MENESLLREIEKGQFQSHSLSKRTPLAPFHLFEHSNLTTEVS